MGTETALNPETSMKVLVTGGAGKVGTAVTAGLAAHGDTVRVLDRVKVTNDRVAESIVGTVSDKATVAEAVRGVDAVIHLTFGMKGAGMTEDEEWDSNLQVNLVGTCESLSLSLSLSSSPTT